MAVIHLLTLMMCWCAVEVNSQQTFPYVSFMGQTLADHSYVNLNRVGEDYYCSSSVQCHTDLVTCCYSVHGLHRGDWYFPNGNRLPFSDSGGIYERRTGQRLTYVIGTLPPHKLVSIAVIFQLKLSIMTMTTQ